MTGAGRALRRAAREVRSQPPGVSRYDVICGPEIHATTTALVRRWAKERALREWDGDRLCIVASAALEYGFLFRPRAMTLRVGWLDLDRIGLDVRWYGGDGAAPGTVDTDVMDSTVAILDALAESWGFGPGTPGAQWMVLRTES